MKQDISIVGIAGLPRSGKDTLAELFMAEDYFGVSLGDIVRDVSRERHTDQPDPISVANMTETSNWLRSEKGPDFALQEALRRYHIASVNGTYHGLVVFSVRAPVEVDFILRHNGKLVWVEADDTVRYERATNNRRIGEIEISFDEFKAQEALQWQPQPGLAPEVQMDIAYVRAKATHEFVNNANDMNIFTHNARKLLTELKITS